MIWKFVKGLIADFSFLSHIPREVFYGIAALIAAWWIYDTGHDAGEADCEGRYEAAARKAIEQARQADAVAGDVVQSGKQEVEAGNRQARDAAKNSSDPLQDGLKALK